MKAKSKTSKAKTAAKNRAPSPSGKQSETSTQAGSTSTTGTAVVERRGGYRPGAGRKVGSRPGQNIHTLKNEVLHYRNKYKKMPLDHLLHVLNENAPDKIKGEKDLDYIKRFVRWQNRVDWAAVQSAPFMHAKLASVEIVDNGKSVQQPVDLKKLTPEELDTMEALVRKASINPDDAQEIELDETEYHEVEADDQ